MSTPNLSASTFISSSLDRGAIVERPSRGVAVLVDEDAAAIGRLRGGLASQGIELCVVNDLAGLGGRLHGLAPVVIVTEMRLRDGTAFDVLAERLATPAPVVIATHYGSIASAVRAIRMGAAGYLAKPADAAQILSAAGISTAGPAEPGPASVGGPPSGCDRLTLDRAIWEVINQALDEAGTISGAARRLGLHARSLRRMLAKHAPPR